MISNKKKLQGVIFDFDNTIVLTDCLESFRVGRNKSGLDQYLRVNNFQLFEGLLLLLNELKNADIPIGIVTNSPKWYVERLLNQLSIKEFFSAVISYDDVGPDDKKPSPKGIRLALEHMKLISSQDILYIGDDKNDVIAAYRAGVTPIIGKWTHSIKPISYIPAGVLSVESIINLVVHGTEHLNLFGEICADSNSWEPIKKRKILYLDVDSNLVNSSDQASIYSFGRYFAVGSEATTRLHNRHSLTQQILEKENGDPDYRIPSYWVKSFKHFIDSLEQNKNLIFNIVTVIPAKKNKVKRLENMLSEIQDISDNKVTLYIQDLFYFEDNAASLKSLNRSDRHDEISKSLKLNNQYIPEIKNANIIIIDDVSTSGATLSEAIKILVSSGASKNVYGLCMAKTVSLPKDDRMCPTCQGALKLQTNSRTGGSYWTCPKKDKDGNYLKHFYEDVKEKDCPECGRPMVRQSNKKDGRIFLGCSGFRENNKCKYTEKVS